MGWQRFNRTTNVFEVSDNNGASWQTLVIAAAGLGTPALPANIAYRDINNNFVAQSLGSYSTIIGGNSALYFNDPAAPAGSTVWRILQYSNGHIYLESLNDSGAATGQIAFIRGTGGINCGPINSGAIVSNSSIQSTAPIYPGGGVTAGPQASWYFGAHSSYGIYCNTGIYVEAGVHPNYVEGRAHVRSAAGMYDYARGTPMGVWIEVDPNSVLDTPHLPRGGQYVAYTLVGKTMHIQWMWNGQIGIGVPDQAYYRLILPAGASVRGDGGSTFMCYDATGWNTGLVNWSGGLTFLYLYASNLRPWQQGQISYAFGSVSVFIN